MRYQTLDEEKMQEIYKVIIKRPFEVNEELLSKKSLHVSTGLFAKTNIGGVHGS